MKYVCVCGYIYDEDLGDEENGMIVTKPDVLSSLAERILDQIGKEGAYP